MVSVPSEYESQPGGVDTMNSTIIPPAGSPSSTNKSQQIAAAASSVSATSNASTNAASAPDRKSSQSQQQQSQSQQQQSKDIAVPTPRRVGPYEIGATIGQGTFGKVKRGTHTATGQQVAIKLLERSRLVDAADKERLRREIGIMRRVGHVNVVRLLDVIDGDAHIFVIMSLIEGQELFDYIVARGKLRDNEACRVFHQIINGVHYCHQVSFCLLFVAI